jgi:dephospho-CoA kinase
MERMTTLGIVGGVASGKSLVSQQFAELGAGLLDADRAGHEVLANDPDERAALIERWGPAILAGDGSVDRRAVAVRVFGHSEKAADDREFLENLLHPRIQQRLDEQRQQFAAAGRSVVVLDAPLLLEASWGPMCDVIVYVDTPRAVRLARANGRGWDETEFDRREAAQWPVEKKRSSANVVIPNGGSADELRAAVRSVWDQYVHRC